jgi:dephospho-CoA kinase
MYCIGLTGQLASGKSTVATYFSKLGVDVINADLIAKELTVSNQPAFTEIINHFGQSVLTTTGELDRRRLRQLIFNDTHERLWIEKLLHPLIRNEIIRKINEVKTPYCLIEIPLLTDKAHYPYLNRVLLVQAEPEQQISRFMTRDNGTREEALAIVATQASKNEHRTLADDVLFNTGSLADLKHHVEELHANYLSRAHQV